MDQALAGEPIDAPAGSFLDGLEDAYRGDAHPHPSGIARMAHDGVQDERRDGDDQPGHGREHSHGDAGGQQGLLGLSGGMGDSLERQDEAGEEPETIPEGERLDQGLSTEVELAPTLAEAPLMLCACLQKLWTSFSARYPASMIICFGIESRNS